MFVCSKLNHNLTLTLVPEAAHEADRLGRVLARPHREVLVQRHDRVRVQCRVTRLVRHVRLVTQDTDVFEATRLAT